MTDPIEPPFLLGPADTFASPEELASYLGGVSGGPGRAASTHDQRRNLALIAASRWVAYRIGIGVTDDPIPPGDVTVTPVDARPAWRAATLVVATRFYRSADAVFGAMGGFGDDAVIVRAAIPEAELLLVGQTVSWGIA
jgi:hypothetical protein